MKETIFSLVAILAAGLCGLTTSCERQNNDDPPGDPVPIDLTLKQKEVVEAANEFAFDLFAPMVTQHLGESGLPTGV